MFYVARNDSRSDSFSKKKREEKMKEWKEKVNHPQTSHAPPPWPPYHPPHSTWWNSELQKFLITIKI